MKRRWGIGTGLLLVGLFVLHHDFWNWESGSRILGLPIGLAYHASYCVVLTLIFARLTRHMGQRTAQTLDPTSGQNEEGDRS